MASPTRGRSMVPVSATSFLSRRAGNACDLEAKRT
jgi:hypothetical protein